MGKQATSQSPALRAVPQLPHETLYVGIDIGKNSHTPALSPARSCSGMNALRGTWH